MEVKDRIIIKFKDKNDNEYTIKQKNNSHYYLIIRENGKDDERLNMINVSFMSRKEKEEFTNKRNCLLVQKHCYAEILKIVKGVENERYRSKRICENKRWNY